MNQVWRAAVAAGIAVGTLTGAPEGAGAPVKEAAESVKRLSQTARLRYNRVEGLFVGYRVYVRPFPMPWGRLFTETGIGLHNRSLRWETGVDLKSDRAQGTISLFDRTTTNDSDIISEGENSFYSLLFKRDFKDYYRTRNGFEVSGSVDLQRHVTASGAFSVFATRSMKVETSWGLFYPDRVFRSNPPVTEADGGRLDVGVEFDNRAHGPLFRNAWVVGVAYERGFRELPYNGFIASASRYQKLIFGNQAVVVRARIGSRDSRHVQHLFYLGGVSTLRGYAIKDYTGNRMALFSAEYLFRGDVLGRVPVPGFQLLNLSLFADTGWTDLVPSDASVLSGFSSMSPGNFKTDLGAAVGVTQEWLRFDIARRMDGTGPDNWTYLLRFMYKL